MLPSLIKFVVRTRFSRPFLAIIGLVVVYSVAVSAFIPTQKENLILGDYGTAIIAFFLAMALATGGVMVLQSDRDYLFTLPLSKRDLSIAIFFSQFIAFGISILFIFVYLARSLASAFLLVDLVALALAVTSLGIIATSLTAKVRALLSVFFAIWTLLALANFPLSPASAFNGAVYGGTATLVVLAAVTTATAFRSLSRIELDMMRNLVRSTSSEVKFQNSYAGKSPVRAIYSMNLSSVSLAGRVNMAGTSRYVSRRVRTRWVVAETTAAAVAYLAFVVLHGPPAPLVTGTDTLPAAIVVAIILSFLGFFFSQSAIANERIWLSLTSLPPATYFRHLVASKVLSFLLVLAPFAAADAALFALGYGEALGALAVVTLVIPGAFVLQILWSAYIVPIQVKGDDQTMVGQFSLRQLSTTVAFLPTILLAAVATIAPVVAVAGGGILIVVSTALTLSGRFWGRVVAKMADQGFV